MMKNELMHFTIYTNILANCCKEMLNWIIFCVLYVSVVRYIFVYAYTVYIKKEQGKMRQRARKRECYYVC